MTSTILPDSGEVAGTPVRDATLGRLSGWVDVPGYDRAELIRPARERGAGPRPLLRVRDVCGSRAADEAISTWLSVRGGAR